MNSTDFYIAAGEAICVWGKTHNEACTLEQMEGVVFCLPATKEKGYHKLILFISKPEIKNGMDGARWNQIGTELYNLYVKELANAQQQKSSK